MRVVLQGFSNPSTFAKPLPQAPGNKNISKVWKVRGVRTQPLLLHGNIHPGNCRLPAVHGTMLSDLPSPLVAAFIS